MQNVAAGLITAGLGGLFFFALDPEGVAPGWWALAWGAFLVGVVLVVTPPLRHSLATRRSARVLAAAQAAEAIASYRAPVARMVEYREGRWWLLARPGSRSNSLVRCQVFDPLGRTPLKEFGQIPMRPDDPIVLWYPQHFTGIRRPLPTGEHVVVWSFNTDGDEWEEARTAFTVSDDAAAMTKVRADLVALRVSAEGLLRSLPGRSDSTELDPDISAFFQTLKRYLEDSPHLGAGEWHDLGTTVMHENTSLKEAAQTELRGTIGTLDELIERFGPEEGSL